MSYLKRKRLGLTDYKKRLRLISSNKPRLVVRRTLKHLTAQIVQYNPNGDLVITSANTKELSKYGWKRDTNNIPSSYLLGILIGKKAHKKNIKDPILDLGLQRPAKKGVLYALLKGAIDAGLNIPSSKEAFPEEQKIKGEHIKNFPLDDFKKTKESIEQNA